MIRPFFPCALLAATLLAGCATDADRLPRQLSPGEQAFAEFAERYDRPFRTNDAVAAGVFAGVLCEMLDCPGGTTGDAVILSAAVAGERETRYAAVARAPSRLDRAALEADEALAGRRTDAMRRAVSMATRANVASRERIETLASVARGRAVPRRAFADTRRSLQGLGRSYRLVLIENDRLRGALAQSIRVYGQLGLPTDALRAEARRQAELSARFASLAQAHVALMGTIPQPVPATLGAAR
jgi:hypothetical protein